MIKLFLRIKRILSLLWCIRPWGDLKSKSNFLIKSHGIKIKLLGQPLPESNEISILASNHVSYLDSIILSSVINCRPIAKASLLKWPILSYCLRRAGVLFYKRGDVISGFKVLNKSIQLLNKGQNILIFPEGTTTNGDEVLPFNRGIFGVSKLTKMPVIPVRINFNDNRHCWWGQDRNFFKHYWWQIGQKTTECTVFLGPSIEPDESVSAKDEADLIRSLIHALK